MKPITYFGKAWPSNLCDDAEQVETPVGKRCRRCHEKFKEGDQGVIDSGDSPLHKNCFLRSTVGSVAHVEHSNEWGGCDGTCAPDDPALSIRDAADAAVAAWERKMWGQNGYSFALGSDRHGDYIICDICGKKSYHPKDIENHYCGFCKQLHSAKEGK